MQIKSKCDFNGISARPGQNDDECARQINGSQKV